MSWRLCRSLPLREYAFSDALLALLKKVALAAKPEIERGVCELFHTPSFQTAIEPGLNVRMLM